MVKIKPFRHSEIMLWQSSGKSMTMRLRPGKLEAMNIKASMLMFAFSMGVLCHAQSNGFVRIVQNGGFESYTGTINGSSVFQSWVNEIGDPFSDQYSTHPIEFGPITRGLPWNLTYLFGGQVPLTAVTQRNLPITVDGQMIDNGLVKLRLSAWLGGFRDQDDYATCDVLLRDQSGGLIGQPLTIGPVTRIMRNGVTGMMQLSKTIRVPAGVRKVDVIVSLVRLQGTANNGMADDVVVEVGTGLSGFGD